MEPGENMGILITLDLCFLRINLASKVEICLFVMNSSCGLASLLWTFCNIQLQNQIRDGGSVGLSSCKTVILSGWKWSNLPALQAEPRVTPVFFVIVVLKIVSA
jgi:hypothetical protein